MCLKNIDLSIKQGEFVCIIGDVGCGKSSLLQAVIGDMMYVSNETIKELGGNDATLTGEEFIKLQKTYLKKPIGKENQPVQQRGSIAYCE
jgi:ABC-type nitrate/sulfonate/bicarbonate transport system ATPase subunit